MMRRIATLPLLLSLLMLVGACASSSNPHAVQPEPAPSAAPALTEDLDRVLGVEPAITVGKLDNGLTYYILPHHKPENRVYLWLGVDAGSVLEDEDQRGLAHFVEHMAFNGTAKFEKMEIINYLESIGMKFGPEINAYTSFDETVYMLQVPTDDDAVVDRGIEILREWAGAISFDPGEVDKERGVVTEEWRLGRGAGMRIADKQYPVLFKGSPYGDRLPIGKKEIIESAPRDTLARFYRDWYRPELMAVVVVGDIDPAAIEHKIAERFGDMTTPANARERAPAAAPGHAGTLVSVETDPEMSMTMVGILNKMPSRALRTVGDYRRFVMEQIYQQMLKARLDEIRERPDAPFVFTFVSIGDMVRGYDVFSRSAMVKEGQVEPALTTLFEEVLRVERHGFTAGELDRAKKSVLRDYQQSAIEHDKRDGSVFASEILRHFLAQEMMPGIAVELKLVEGFLPGIELAELNVLAQQWGGRDNRVILISGPDTLSKPTRAQVLAWVEAAGKREVVAYQDQPTRPLMATPPKPGSITGEQTIAELGVHEWTLSNGVRVVFKPTDFKNDEIRLEAFSAGGHSLVPDAAYDSARFAARIVGGGGVGDLDAAALRKALAGKVAQVSAHIWELEEGLSGSASPQDLETFMQLIYLRFTAPRKDANAFAAWRSRQLEWVRNRRLDPEWAFFDDMEVFFSAGHLRRQPTTAESVARVKLDEAFEIYRDRFGDAGDFTFVFVGNIDVARFRPLVERYLASLPSTGRVETWKDVGVRPPAGIARKVVHRGSEPKSFVYLKFHGAEKWSPDAANDMLMLEEVLSIRLREVLREDMGGVYGSWESGWIARHPVERRGFTVFFGCSPDNAGKLEQAVFAEARALAKNGIGAGYIEKVTNARLRSREVDLKDNEFWSRELRTAYRFGDDPRRIISEFQPMVDKISSDRIRAAARRYLDPSEYALGVLRPGKK